MRYRPVWKCKCLYLWCCCHTCTGQVFLWGHKMGSYDRNAHPCRSPHVMYQTLYGQQSSFNNLVPEQHCIHVCFGVTWPPDTVLPMSRCNRQGEETTVVSVHMTKPEQSCRKHRPGRRWGNSCETNRQHLLWKWSILRNTCSMPSAPSSTAPKPLRSPPASPLPDLPHMKHERQKSSSFSLKSN